MPIKIVRNEQNRDQQHSGHVPPAQDQGNASANITESQPIRQNE